jgi:hypothetical protein
MLVTQQHLCQYEISKYLCELIAICNNFLGCELLAYWQRFYDKSRVENIVRLNL